MRPEKAAVPFVLLLVTALSLSSGPLAAESTPRQQVEAQLMCYCGCSDLTVRVCTCGTADAIREEITGRLANGETPDQVVAAFVARHGEQIRSAPTKTGFNLVGWVTPFVLIILAGSALVVTVRRWGSLRISPATASGPAGTGPDHEQTSGERTALERVRREMRERR